MVVLHIEHPVPDYEGWKRAFDADPVGRKKMGVRRYRVSRAVDDPKFVMIDLEFDTVAEAEGLLAAMRVVWGNVQGTIMNDPKARVAEVVEVVEV